jgi:hypothetical protein
MKDLKFGLFASLFAVGGLFFSLLTPSTALAYSPILSVNNQYGNNLTLTISGGVPNSTFQLYYTLPGSSLPSVVSNSSWVTDYNGYYSTTINSSDYGISSGSLIYVKFYNGDQSNQVYAQGYGGSGSGCGYYGCNVGGLSFSQNNVNLNVGQSVYVSISSGVYMYNYPPYISSNSNSSVAYASISGSQLYITGNSTGSTTITVCLSGGSTCGSVYVTVGSSYNYGNITFSQSSVSLNVGQSQNVSIYNSNYYNNSYYISGNSNSSAVTASISGATLYLYGQSSGSSTITVCQNNFSQCGYLYVTVSGSGYSNITFNDANPAVNVTQSRYISIYSNVSGSFYISSNSNQSVVDASISGSSLYLYGRTSGSSTLTICQYNNNQCSYLYVTVSGGGFYGGLYFNPSSVNVNAGQSATVTASLSYPYTGNLYLSSNTNSNVATASFSGSTIYVYGQNPGSTTMSICYNNQCANLSVTVSGYGGGYGYGSGLYFTTTSLPQPTVGQYYSQQLQVSGGTSPYYYSLQSGSLPSGLSLSSSGQIFGTPQNTNLASFVIRVSDNYGRVGTANLTLTPLSGSVLGISNYNNGALISEYGTVYIVYRNTKAGFTTSWVFRNLGYSFSNVTEVGNSGLADSGYVVRSAYTSHPWGSWIKSGRTVYFVHENGLIPISSYDIFLNNGGEDRLTVAPNSYDFQRPILPLMDYNDARLR